MLKTSLFLLVSVTALPAEDMPGALGGGSVTLDSGVVIKNTTVIEPPIRNSAFLPLGTGFRSDGNTMRFIICDNAARSCFGFHLSVSAGGSPDTRLATLGPLGPEGAGMSIAITGEPAMKQQPLPKYPAPQMIHDGDTVLFDLMVSADGAERVVEYLQFDFGNKPAKTAAASARPRDFTLDDGPVNFSIDHGDVLLNGAKPATTPVFLAGRGGATLWAYFPGRGRYILSLAPHEGFVKAGTVRAGHISFQADGQQVDIHLGKPLAGTQAAWNLYVFHDPQFVPALKGQQPWVLVSADRLDNLMPGR